MFVFSFSFSSDKYFSKPNGSLLIAKGFSRANNLLQPEIAFLARFKA